MNDRIKQLLEQAGVKFVVMPKDTEYEKFAELIVEECVDIANKNRTAMEMDRNTHLTADAIKQHFGVEE